MGFVVAVDGPSGSGKGTITKLVGEKVGLINIDTGAMYRCVTVYMLRNNIKLEDEEKITEMLKNINIEFRRENNIEKVYLNNEDVTREIRTKEVNELVSQVSHVIEIRENITNLSRKVAKGKKVIMEGRDIGTNVFPNADIKIYLDATPEERANRRLKQNMEKGMESSYEEILENIKFRDNNDKTSKVAPLKQAEDAIYIDSTNMNIDEVVNEITKIIEEKKGRKETKLKKVSATKLKDEKKVSTSTSNCSIGKRILRAIVKGAIYAYCKIVYRAKIIGTENIPKDGALIFCGNHRSFLDPPLIEVTCKRDDTRFLAKKELTKNKLLKLLGIIFDAILVNRDSKDVAALKESLKTLKSGGCIALFPEGTRNGLAKGEKAKDGVAYFALNSDAKVIPVGIKGGLKPFQKVVITYGKPIDFSEYKANRKDKETMDKVTDEIMKEIIKLT